MTPPSSIFKRYVTQLRLTALALAAFYAALAWWLVYGFFLRVGYEGHDAAGLIPLLEGAAPLPYAAHMLLPAMANLLRLLLPEFAIDAINSWGASGGLPDYAQPYHLYFIVMALMFLSLLAYAGVMALLGRHFFPGSTAAMLIAPGIALLALPSHFSPGLRVYDFPTLLLSAGCLYAMARREWGAYLLWFAAALLNHLACAFFLFYFLLAFRRELPPPQWLRLALLQSLIALGAVLLLQLLFRDQPNTGLPFGAGAFFDVLTGSYSYVRFLEALVAALLLTYRWAEKPLLLKRALWFLPLFILGALAFGLTYDYSAYFPLHPFLVLLCAHTLVSAARQTPMSSKLHINPLPVLRAFPRIAAL